MDCEGCEFDILLNDYDHVRLFNELIIEYHESNGYKLGDLIKLLANDYRCRRVVERPGLGVLHCVKR